MEERPPEPPTRPILETQAEPAEPGQIPPFEPLLEQPVAIEPVPEPASEAPVSAVERERAGARAAAACAQGRVTLGAYSDLVEIFAGEERVAFDQALQELRQAETAAIVPAGRRVDATLIAVLSGQHQNGALQLGPATRLVSVMGEVDLDLREATVSGPVTTIRSFTVMGSIKVRIPPGIRVETTSVPIMGDNDVSLKGPAPRADAPLIRFEMTSVMGGVDVKDHGGMRDLIRQGMALGAAGMSDARVRLHDSRIEARRAAREARHAAHRARHHHHP